MEATQEIERSPFSLKAALEQNRLENILDSNMFAAYIPHELDVPRIEDPRRSQGRDMGTPRHPAQIKSAYINQVFNYIGFIKRCDNKEYRKYLPVLFQELKTFFRVLEEIIFTLDVSISIDIHNELKNGLENFFSVFRQQTHHGAKWIEDIRKHQKLHLENIDMLIESLRIRNKVFDFSDDPLHNRIVTSCRKIFFNRHSEHPSEADFNFAANCCLKAAADNTSKTIWSGDMHIAGILNIIYKDTGFAKEFPQVYLRASYDPFRYTQLFP